MFYFGQVSSQVSESPRKGLSPRQVETVTRLLDAGLAQLTDVGPEALTIRQVAVRAGVSPATAYTYLASKNHLIAELFLRHLVEDPGAEPNGTTPLERVASVIHHLVDSLSAEPQLSAGATGALLASDPDVARLRMRIGGEFVRRFEAALGRGGSPAVVEALVLAFSGALLQVGMGLLTYPEMRRRMDVVAATIMEGNA